MQFFDVLVFNITYKTNKFKYHSHYLLVLIIIQSTLFGGALLENETANTFVWLFTQFGRCKFDRPLTAIITD